MTRGLVLVLWHQRDEARAGRLVRALEEEGFPAAGECVAACREERDVVDRAMREAGCIIALWSRASTGPEAGFMLDQAVRANQRGILIGVSLETTLLSGKLDGMPLIDLAGWRGSRQNPHFRELVAAVRATQAARAAAANDRMIPFYRRIGANLTAGGVALGLFGFAMNLFGVQRELCAIPSGYLISDVCGAIGLGGQPSRSERLAFERLPAGNCDALQRLRPHLRSEVLKEEAARRLSGRDSYRSDTFAPSPRPWRSYVRTPARPFGSMAHARADAQARARADAAAQGCAPRDRFERLAGVDVTPIAFQCARDLRGGFACALDYAAQCRVEARAQIERCR